MAEKKITKNIKLKIMAGKATPAPPLGPALGQAGIAIGDFVSKFNADTKDKTGLLGVKIRVFEDRSYEYDIKTPITTTLIKEKAGITKGNSKTGNAGKMTEADLRAIATEKMVDLNAHTVEQAMLVIRGSARSMGVKIVD